MSGTPLPSSNSSVFCVLMSGDGPAHRDDGDFGIDGVAISQDSVIVRWCPTSLVASGRGDREAGPRDPRPVFLEITDDLGTEYYRSSASTSYREGSSGTVSFVPAPPPEARVIELVMDTSILRLDIEPGTRRLRENGRRPRGKSTVHEWLLTHLRDQEKGLAERISALVANPDQFAVRDVRDHLLVMVETCETFRPRPE